LLTALSAFPRRMRNNKDKALRASRKEEGGFTSRIASLFSKFLGLSPREMARFGGRKRIFTAFKKEFPRLERFSDIKKKITPDERRSFSLRYLRSHRLLGAACGAGFGSFGISLAPLEEYSLALLRLRLASSIAYSFGYDLSRPEEREFLVQAMASPSGRKPIKPASLRYIMTSLARKVISLVVRDEARSARVKRMLTKIGLNLTERRMLAFIPLFGAVVSAGFNYREMERTALSLVDLYHQRAEEEWRRRRLLWFFAFLASSLLLFFL